MDFSPRAGTEPPGGRHQTPLPDLLIERASWAFGSFVSGLGRYGVKPRRPAPALPATEIMIESGDGVEIAATYWPGWRSNGPAVLIVHGFMASRKTIQPNADWFAANGFAVLTIDLRGHGASGDAPCGFGWSESQDVHAAFAWLKTKQAGAKVAVIGISMGGAAALVGPRGPVAADALVLQAVFPDIHRAIHTRMAVLGGERFAEWFEPLLAAQARPRLGISPAQLAPVLSVEKFVNPLLVIGGALDRFTPPDETRALYDAAPGQKSLWIIPDLGHTGVCDTLDQTYRERVLAFLYETVGKPYS